MTWKVNRDISHVWSSERVTKLLVAYLLETGYFIRCG